MTISKQKVVILDVGEESKGRWLENTCGRTVTKDLKKLPLVQNEARHNIYSETTGTDSWGVGKGQENDDPLFHTFIFYHHPAVSSYFLTSSYFLEVLIIVG